MTAGDPGARPLAQNWRWPVLVSLLILVVAGLRIGYLALACPLDLSPDEAHYWDWSRHPDWSYYSKGPLVAYLIRWACALAGPLSERLTDDQMLAVRLPAVLCGSLLLAAWYCLARQVYSSQRLATAVVALALTLPVVSAGSSLMTIDAPYTCCWGWALVLGYQAAFRRSAWAWPLAGLVLGLGVLAKYTMVLWLPSFVLFLISSPGHRGLLLRPGFWLMTALAAVLCLPLVLWNAQHDWVSLRHVGGQAGLGHGGFCWSGPVQYVGVQCGLLLCFWFLAWLAAMVAHRPGSEPQPAVRYLWWMSAPMFIVFSLFSFKEAGEANWPVTAYISGLVLTVAWLGRQLHQPALWYRRLTAVCLVSACSLGLGVSLFMHYSHWALPLTKRLAGPPTTHRPLPLRRLDPTCRLRGWRTLAAAVDGVRRELRTQGVEPVLAGSAWPLPGELAFYCQGHPPVYSLGMVLGDRRSQYDLWRPNPVWDPDHFRGCTVILVGEGGPVLRQAFDRLEPPRLVVHRVGGQPVARWTVTICRGFRGFPHLPNGSDNQRY
jgi:hypothetical protein